MSHWVALCSPLSDFSFQLSAFQLLPNCGFVMAWVGFPPGRRWENNQAGKPPTDHGKPTRACAILKRRFATAGVANLRWRA